MADPDARHSYFNTTQGVLIGNPDHCDIDKILEVLDENKIVYLYDSDKHRHWPTFYSQGKISIGLDEIIQAIQRLGKASKTSSTPDHTQMPKPAQKLR